MDDVQRQFAVLGLATFIYDSECLDLEEECYVTDNIKNCPAQVASSPVITNCEDQGIASLSLLTNSCLYNASISEAGSGASYATFNLDNDTIYQAGELRVLFTDSCGVNGTSTIVAGGCSSTTGCVDANKANYLVFRYTDVSQAFSIENTGYITSLRIYETDALGTLIPTPIDLDLDPATSPYYTAHVTDCPGCTTVNASDVQFGSANFISSMGTLMDNVSLARYGSTGKHNMKFNKLGSSFAVGCYVKHNPSGNHFGIKRDDINVNWYQPSATRIHNLTATNYNASVLTPTRFYKTDLSFTSNCGNVEPDILDQYVSPHIDSASTDFHYLGLISSYGVDNFKNPKTLTLSGTTSASCDQYTLTGSYSGSGTVSGVEWLDPSLVQISTAYSVNVTATGNYTFRVTLDSGCIIMKGINVPNGNTFDVELG